MTFYDLDFTDELLDSLDAMRFSEPTPIQEQAIPVIMEGRDHCLRTDRHRQDGALPAADNRRHRPQPERRCRHDNPRPDPRACHPDRPADERLRLLRERLVDATIYGGSDSGEWSRQRTALSEGADIVIATPGRMLQHISMGYVDFSKVRHLVLDEADRMLDMGFYDDIMQVVKLLPVEARQTLMFSATMPPKIRDLAKTILSDPRRSQ